MFDENGIWQDDRYLTPGSMGTPALDIMNVMQSGQNYQKNMALKALQEMLAVGHDPNAPAAFQSPQMATATGLPQADVDQFYGNMPSTQFRSQFSAATPAQQVDPDFIQTLGVTTGAEAPNAALASNIKLQQELGKSDRNVNTQFAKYVETARKAMASRSDPVEGAKVATGIIRAGGAQLGIDENTMQDAIKSITSSVAGMAIDPKIQSVINDKNSLSDYRQMQTSLLPAKTQSQIALWDSTTGLHNVEASLKAIDLAYAKNGAISPALKARLETSLNVAIASVQGKGGSLADLLAGDDPGAAAALKARREAAIKTLEDHLQKLNQMGGTPAVPSTPAAPTKKTADDPLGIL